MNVFIREMKANIKATIIWSIGAFILIGASMVKYSTFSATGQSMNDLIAQMPRSLQTIMGLSTFDISKASGYYGVLFIYLEVMAAIHAAILGANIISKEERDKTAEFLFVKPVSRNKIVILKVLVALVNILILNLITLVSSIFMVQRYSNDEGVIVDIVSLIAGMFVLQLIFLFIATATAAVSKTPKSASSLSTGILLATFILSIVIDMNSRIENLRYFTPFKYYDPKNLMFDKGFERVYIILSVIIITILLVVTSIFYKKRDLKI